ncbi:MAG: biotin-dependent carboxyltransferase family protein [Gemmataceae bacterium]|nr:biotin-dependent carboxyltransferase family protein [Gemmataceae bacterium]
MSFRVVEPGPLSLVVDLGRPRWRSFGVPLGGAADRAALVQGNALVGNPPDAAGLEFAAVGPTLLAETDAGCVVFGAPFSVMIDGHPVRPGVTFVFRAGSTLKIGPPAQGFRGYLCVAGGFDVPVIMESRSALEPIRKGDRLACSGSCSPGRSIAEPWCNIGSESIRCVAGPQHHWFTDAEFFGPTFTVTPASNRMGLRLAGLALKLPGREMVSEPVVPGSVQVVNDGSCIVLGVDGQTIGGYPKVAVVCDTDLDRLGQLRPGQAVRFDRIGIEHAEQLAGQRDAWLRGIVARLAAAIR